ncbi:putative glucan endo-beta-glucosidase btgc [Phaeomoniella chlamydospora]|uniref:glucan endo-1,3-beta-D-glucosidase n=1 Tax=Phaeomoniella chlamydospora TaxID=158046 RepID=A0A0G2E863_PHACM|nr:putative glucan endo-beta-glucosidase btgc [Phaeomoniella chlamydospora]
MKPRHGTVQNAGSFGSDTQYATLSRPDDLRRAQTGSFSSSHPIVNAAAMPGTMTPQQYPSSYSTTSIPMDEYPTPSQYRDSPYLFATRSHNDSVQLATIDPYKIADDGDDGFIPDPKRRSMLSLKRKKSRDTASGVIAADVAAGPIVSRSLSSMMKKNNMGSQATNYKPGGLSNSSMNDSSQALEGEKSDWLSRQTRGNNKMKWTLFLVIGGIVLIAIIGGIIGGVAASKSHKSSASPNDASHSNSSDTDFGKDSAQVKTLMNNSDLHKVFPAIDYTPWAVLSQLTNTVRLYGTDCNQTQMVLHAIDKLELTEMRISEMYRILDNAEDLSVFKGVIVGNEVLYRAGTSKTGGETSLIKTIKEIRTNFTSKGYNLTVTTSDLGDNWNAEIVNVVDVVMSNIHPFFAGVTASAAAGWTWSFWQNNDVVLTEGTSKKQIISETGWPSGGGNDCGTTTDCTTKTSGSVAGVTEMNTFMEDWVCQALKNGTEYFWFEAFDEPWKVIYNTKGKEWEDKWGLMDPARKIKDGLKIPDCDGQTVS